MRGIQEATSHVGSVLGVGFKDGIAREDMLRSLVAYNDNFLFGGRLSRDFPLFRQVIGRPATHVVLRLFVVLAQLISFLGGPLRDFSF